MKKILSVGKYFRNRGKSKKGDLTKSLRNRGDLGKKRFNAYMVCDKMKKSRSENRPRFCLFSKTRRKMKKMITDSSCYKKE